MKEAADEVNRTFSRLASTVQRKTQGTGSASTAHQVSADSLDSTGEHPTLSGAIHRAVTGCRVQAGHRLEQVPPGLAARLERPEFYMWLQQEAPRRFLEAEKRGSLRFMRQQTDK